MYVNLHRRGLTKTEVKEKGRNLKEKERLKSNNNLNVFNWNKLTAYRFFYNLISHMIKFM